MPNISPHPDLPRAILHVDGDGFFAGCEVAKDPSLAEKPVVVGRERGMAIAMNYIAKRMGVTRGMHMRDVARICPTAVILDADHATYELFSRRMNNIIGRYTPLVDHYSIDESFADITATGGDKHTIGLAIKSDLKRELGMTFSVGIAPTKVLAKLASNFQKPDGLTMIPLSLIPQFLKKSPIEKIWGIGPRTASRLRACGVLSAHEFTQKPEEWVVRTLAKPYQEIWHELRGESVLALNTKKREPQRSFMRTRTFSPATEERTFLLAELSRHSEVLCARLRSHGLAAKTITFFLKTRSMQFYDKTVPLAYATNIPEDILAAITAHLDEAWRPGTSYRATGISVCDLTEEHTGAQDLFDTSGRSQKLEHLYAHIDALRERYGKSMVHLASSTSSLASAPMDTSERDQENWDRTGIPMIGMIS